jgi:hypothetical protein
VRAALDDATSWRVEGERLVLAGPTGRLVLRR